MKLTVDFAKPLRPMGKLNGMNNGPLTAFFDHTEEYKEMGIDHVRFHETHSYNTKCVEMPFIFRNFDADENDPANYYFKETDAVIKAAVDAGIEIVYRLGMGTEGDRPFLFMGQPKDHAKWARICEHIVMHYNEGWADGFHYNIMYWEIWNEADSPNYWTGDRLDFIPMYKVAWNHLKKRFPHLKFGSTGFAHVRPAPPKKFKNLKAREEWKSRMMMNDAFMELIRSGEADMDFYAFHMYTSSIDGCRARMNRTMSLLNDHGLGDRGYELINTEWNALNLSLIPTKYQSKYALRSGLWRMEQMYTMHCAVDVFAFMMVFQHYGFKAADYYDAEERSRFCGLYDFDRTPRLHHYSMVAFKWLREGETQVESSGFESKTTTACASFNGKVGAIGVANDGDDPQTAVLDLRNLPGSDYEVYLFDEKHKLERVRKGVYNGNAMRVQLPGQSAAVIRFTVREKEKKGKRRK